MISAAVERHLRDRFGDTRLKRHAPLAPLTTFKVGGPADCLVEVQASEVADAIRIAHAGGAQVTVLGGGSNVLVADAGVAGVVLRMRSGSVTQVAPDLVRADAGVLMNGLVRWTIAHARAGLEAWAGTPGTVGGAVHGNAHFQGRLIGDSVAAATLVARDGSLSSVPGSELEFGYDISRLAHTGEILVSADFRVGDGDPTTLRATARESLAFRKRTQPLASPSAGCIFQNPDPARDRVPDGIPASAGALVDRAGLKGARHGGAVVSTTHANFIVNEGGATAADIRTLVEQCRRAVLDRFGVGLREEIVYVGFGGANDGNAQD